MISWILGRYFSSGFSNIASILRACKSGIICDNIGARDSLTDCGAILVNKSIQTHCSSCVSALAIDSDSARRNSRISTAIMVSWPRSTLWINNSKYPRRSNQIITTQMIAIATITPANHCEKTAEPIPLFLNNSLTIQINTPAPPVASGSAIPLTKDCIWLRNRSGTAWNRVGAVAATIVNRNNSSKNLRTTNPINSPKGANPAIVPVMIIPTGGIRTAKNTPIRSIIRLDPNNCRKSLQTPIIPPNTPKKLPIASSVFRWVSSWVWYWNSIIKNKTWAATKKPNNSQT